MSEGPLNFPVKQSLWCSDFYKIHSCAKPSSSPCMILIGLFSKSQILHAINFHILPLCLLSTVSLFYSDFFWKMCEISLVSFLCYSVFICLRFENQLQLIVWFQSIFGCICVHVMAQKPIHFILFLRRFLAGSFPCVAVFCFLVVSNDTEDCHGHNTATAGHAATTFQSI